MLEAVRENYETHHGVKITDEAIDAAVKLSDRYINDRFLPDKAIDVMDEAASSVRLEATERGLLGPDSVRQLEQEIAEIQAQKEAAALLEEYEKAAKLRQRELKVQTQLDEAREQAGQIATLLVTPEDVAKVVEGWSGASGEPDAGR